eukprot:1160925-Pelagomonas_calceolata.AAC.1
MAHLIEVLPWYACAHIARSGHGAFVQAWQTFAGHQEETHVFLHLNASYPSEHVEKNKRKTM